MKEGHELIGKMLHAIQVYKSLGDSERARKFYDKYSEVPQKFFQYKAMMQKKPHYQGLRLFANMAKNGTDKSALGQFDSHQETINTGLVEYNENFKGIISSYEDRIPYSANMAKTMIKEWNKYKSYLKVSQKDIEAKAKLNKAAPTTKKLVQKTDVHKLTAPSEQPNWVGGKKIASDAVHKLGTSSGSNSTTPLTKYNIKAESKKDNETKADADGDKNSSSAKNDSKSNSTEEEDDAHKLGIAPSLRKEANKHELGDAPSLTKNETEGDEKAPAGKGGDAAATKPATAAAAAGKSGDDAHKLVAPSQQEKSSAQTKSDGVHRLTAPSMQEETPSEKPAS